MNRIGSVRTLVHRATTTFVFAACAALGACDDGEDLPIVDALPLPDGAFRPATDGGGPRDGGGATDAAPKPVDAATPADAAGPTSDTATSVNDAAAGDGGLIAVTVRTPAEIAQTSAESYDDNTSGIISGKTLARYVGDWNAQRPTGVTGKLVILNTTPNVTTAKKHVTPNGTNVVSYFIAHSELLVIRSTGVSREDGIPSGSVIDAFLKKYGIDPLRDYVVFAFEQLPADATVTPARAAPTLAKHSVGRRPPRSASPTRTVRSSRALCFRSISPGARNSTSCAWPPAQKSGPIRIRPARPRTWWSRAAGSRSTSTASCTSWKRATPCCSRPTCPTGTRTRDVTRRSCTSS